jgi:hypothetical protein
MIGAGARTGVAAAAIGALVAASCSLFDTTGGGPGAGADASAGDGPGSALPQEDAGPPCDVPEAARPKILGSDGHGGVGAWVAIDVTNVPDPALVTVRFGGADGLVVGETAGKLTVVVPPGATSGQVTVRVGCAIAHADFVVDEVPAPVVTSFTPTSGSLDAGTVITVTGQFFGGAIEVFVADLPQSFTVQDDSTLLFEVTSSPAQPSPVGVRTPSGKAYSTATFTAAP